MSIHDTFHTLREFEAFILGYFTALVIVSLFSVLFYWISEWRKLKP